MSGADSEAATGTRDRIEHHKRCARGSSTAPAAIGREYPVGRSIYLRDLKILGSPKNVTKCVPHTRYAVSTGATGRFYHLVSCTDQYRAGGPRGALAGGRQVP